MPGKKPSSPDDDEAISAFHGFVTGRMFDAPAAAAPDTSSSDHADEDDSEETDNEAATAERARAKRKRGLPIRPSNAGSKRPAKRTSDDPAPAEKGKAAGEQDEDDEDDGDGK